VTLPPVKEFAIKNNIEVLQPSKVKTPEFVSTIRELRPDLLVTAAYGKILPQEVLDIPPYGCVNVHGSLLSGSDKLGYYKRRKGYRNYDNVYRCRHGYRGYAS